MSDQLVLEMHLRADQSFDNFVVGNNPQLLEALKHISDSSLELGIYLFSRPGLGKSHLLNALCQYYQSQNNAARVAYLPLGEAADFSPEVLSGFEQCQLVCIDDLDSVLANPDWEDALFALMNGLLDRGHKLVISSGKALKDVSIQLADLRTRIANLTHYELLALDTEKQFQVFLNQAHEKGISIDEDVKKYIQLRGPRNLTALLSLLDKLDMRSLQAKRVITIPFLKEMVSW